MFQGSAEINYDTLYRKADMALERKNSFIAMYWTAEDNRPQLNRREGGKESEVLKFRKLSTNALKYIILYYIIEFLQLKNYNYYRFDPLWVILRGYTTISV